ncbi:MAG: archaeosortase/exosortase family protein [Deltaproteobacteria bacterium]|nr:archaeosortase/exosortase family protein [Deltaproteobacteria bacterium]
MRWPIARFALVFFACLLGFSVLSVATNLQNHLHVFENGIANASASLAHWFGSTAKVVEGNYISVGTMTLNINHECTGVFVLFVLISFIAAYPSRLWLKLTGIVAGITILSLINVVRIATLVRLVEYYPTLFPYFHEYVWQGAFLMLVTLYAITWVEWSRR